MKSMTGYGRGDATASGISIEVELSSVNRKQCDVRVSLPRTLSALESRVTKLLREKISRGMVSGTVNVRISGERRSRAIGVDDNVVAAYVRAFRAAGKKLKLDDDLTLSTVARLPDVIVVDDATADADKVWRVMRRALLDALQGLQEMRVREGAALEKDLAKRLRALRRSVARIRRIAPTVPQRHRDALLARLEKAKIGFDLENERLLREICVFAERSDISEEITRLASHFEQMDELMATEKPCGRSLDFLCQEFLREINTIGSKANDARLSRLVVDFKSQLECVREQVQNVE